MARLRRAVMTRGPEPVRGGGVVCAVDGVAQPVRRLDAPVVANEGGDVGGGGAGGGQAGHAEGGDRGQERAGGVVDVAFDRPHLVDVRERQVRRSGEDLDGAGGDPTAAGVDVPVCDRVVARRSPVLAPPGPFRPKTILERPCGGGRSACRFAGSVRRRGIVRLGGWVGAAEQSAAASYCGIALRSAERAHLHDHVDVMGLRRGAAGAMVSM
jgi:hypothetical protein